MGKDIPLIAPRPARLSDHLDALRAIEESGIYSNGGPVVRSFEADVVARMFGGRGEALAVNNATVGLMIAIREAAGQRARENGLAIVPAMTFAATAHAAEWAGLTPLVCDVDPQEWSLSAAGEEALLRRYGQRVAVIVPYATFGAAIDLERYGWLSEKYGVGVVIDAAASLGTVDMAGRGFATGSRFAVVFSMHATKAFATAEGGLVYSADAQRIAALADDASAHAIARYAGALGVPLTLAGPFLARVGAELGRIVVRSGGELIDGSEVIEAQRTPSRAWRARVRDCANGVERIVTARNIVLATGGCQPECEVAAARVAGAPLGELAGDRLVTSDALLRLGGVEDLRVRLGELRAPRIAVVGASTSALASAALLLKAAPSLPLGPGAITLLHRQSLRPFYPSADAARADGFDDFGPDDICPLSGFVYRLGGFRLEARELVLRMLEVGGRVRDPRLALHRLGEDDAAARRTLGDADVVIGALGYRPHGLTLRDAAGRRIALAADAPGRPSLVDRHCRVIDAGGAAVAGAYGIGLAAGFVPWGRLGGEASFRGRANGLWLWQNDVGAMIVDQIIGSRVDGGAVAA